METHTKESGLAEFRSRSGDAVPAGRSYVRKVLVLFLLASLIPVVVLSAVMSGLSAGVLNTVTVEYADEILEVSARKLDAYVHTVSRACVALAADLQLLPLLDETRETRDSVIAAVGLIRKRFPNDGPPLDVSIVSRSGIRKYSTRDFPRDYDPASFGHRGLLQKVRSNPAGISVTAKAHRLIGDSYSALSIGTAVLGASGEPVGYVLADIPRETFRSAMAPLPRLPEFLVADATGLIAFNTSSPEREGTFLDEADLEEESVRFRRTAGSLTLAASTPVDLIRGLLNTMRLATFLCLAACCLLSLLLSVVLSRELSRPVRELIIATGRVAGGDLSVAVASRETGEMAALMNGFNSMVAEIRGLLARTVEEQELLKNAELEYLSSQINPHFFFNALSSVNALARLGRCAEIVTVTTALGKLLRSGVGGRARLSTIDESLATTRNYLAIEKIRFGDRFSWTEEVDPALLDCTVPRLSIQSLVENALTHGIEPKADGGRLLIRVLREGNDVLIEVEDDGVGIDPAKFSELERVLESGEALSGDVHVGLANTNRRIRLGYGEPYGIRLATREGGGTLARILIPWRRHAACTE